MRIAIIVLLIILQSCVTRSENVVEDKRANTITKNSVVDSLVGVYKGIRFKTPRRELSYVLQNQFKGRILVTDVVLQDIYKDSDDLFFLIGDKSTAIIKVRLSAENIKSLELKGKLPAHKCAIAISNVSVKKVFEFSVEADEDEVGTDLAMSEGKYLIQGNLIDIVY